MANLKYFDPNDSQWKVLGVAGPTGPQGPAGPTGPAGPQGEEGPVGGTYAYAYWKYQTGTGAPSTGYVKSDASNLYISETDDDGFDRTTGLDLVAIGDTITVKDTNAATWILEVSGAPVDSGTYRTIPITVTSGPEPPKNNQRVLIALAITPATGPTGPTGPAGPGVAAGGTTGQVLAKNSATDYDTGWVNPPSTTVAKLDDIGDVSAPAPADGNILKWAVGASVWIGLPVSVTSSGYYSTQIPENAFDNNTSTDWNTGAEGAPWIIADFGVPKKTNSIFARSSSVARTWTLSGSNNNTDWTIIYAGLSATTGAGTTYSFTEREFRYYKLTGSGTWTDPSDFTLKHSTDQWISAVPATVITDHGALTGLADDDHPQYQKESEKGAASGYASLDAGTKVPIAEIPTGTTGTTVSLGDHAHSGVYDPAGTATGAISTHEGASDPHPQYLTSTEGNAAYEATGAAASAVSSHESALDPHTGYQKESEKGAASGYASLDASTKVPYAQLPTGTAASTVAIGDHGHDYAPTTHSHVEGDLPSTLATDTEVATAVSNHNSGSPHVALASTTPADLGTAAVGVGTTSARADHVHDMPTAVDVGAEASGAVATHAATAGHELMSDTNAVALGTAGPGVGTTVSRTDHVHPMPSAANVGAEPAGTVATHAGTAGHEPLASTNPANLGTAAVGTGTTAARDDHVHAMPVASDVGAPPTARTITSGAGLTGGGDLSADRTLAVGAGTGITVNADDVAVNRTTVDAWYEPAGAVSTHAGAADPHPTYLKPAEVLAGTNMTVDLVTTPGSVILNATGSAGPTIANFVVGSSVAITTGVKKAYWNVQKTGTITAWKIIADTSTTASISVLKSTTMPTFSALGTASITAAQTATGTPSWAVTAGDIMDIEILSNNNATKIVLEITIT